eukprot:TRINITY_DN535_c3_g1_i3.p4 TRINITY_DN535_c3_g1~~TRINITY_DN535_c3_g1_i3.p4  ORF type:complete len:119 (-),score=37.43 TRINITY_DN535_c3_g1_i3:314-670(-)
MHHLSIRLSVNGTEITGKAGSALAVLGKVSEHLMGTAMEALDMALEVVSGEASAAMLEAALVVVLGVVLGVLLGTELRGAGSEAVLEELLGGVLGGVSDKGGELEEELAAGLEVVGVE